MAGGGGGRIAVRTPTLPLSFSTSALGGSGFYGTGQPGSIFVDAL